MEKIGLAVKGKAKLEDEDFKKKNLFSIDIHGDIKSDLALPNSIVEAQQYPQSLP